MKKLRLILVALLPILCGCPDYDIDPAYSIELKNTTDKPVVFFEGYCWPDTSLIELTGLNETNISFYEVEGKGNKQFGLSDFAFCSNKINCFFVIEKSLVETVHWDTIRANYMILKRYDLSEEMLDSMSWTITYP